LPSEEDGNSGSPTEARVLARAFLAPVADWSWAFTGGSRQSRLQSRQGAGRKPSLSEQPYFLSLFQPSLLAFVGIFRKRWLVNLEIQSSQTLDASDELGFRYANRSPCRHRTIDRNAKGHRLRGRVGMAQPLRHAVL